MNTETQTHFADIILSVPWQCGDKDCDQQWHLSTYWSNDCESDIEEGYAYTVDSYTDGDHEPCESIPDYEEERSCWKKYWEHVVCTGTDPLGELFISHSYKVKERYSIRLTRSLRGVQLVGCKRRGKELDYRDLPEHVQSFLELDSTGTWAGPLLKITPEELKEAGIELNKWVTVTIDVAKKRVPHAVERDLKKAARKILRLTRQEKDHDNT
jgi:hypothetical protein